MVQPFDHIFEQAPKLNRKSVKIFWDFGIVHADLLISFEDFKKCDIRIGKVVSAEMIMAADKDGLPVILTPEKEVPPGSVVK